MKASRRAYDELAATYPRRATFGLAALAAGGLLCLLLSIPYATPYIENTRLLGVRDAAEIASYSARLLSYATTSWQNWRGSASNGCSSASRPSTRGCGFSPSRPFW